MAHPPRPLLTTVGKTSACHTRRRKTEGERKEVVISAVIAEGGRGWSPLHPAKALAHDLFFSS